MKVNLQKYRWAEVAVCLSLWSMLAFGQSADYAQNLEACKAGREACDRSK